MGKLNSGLRGIGAEQSAFRVCVSLCDPSLPWQSCKWLSNGETGQHGAGDAFVILNPGLSSASQDRACLCPFRVSHGVPDHQHQMTWGP